MRRPLFNFAACTSLLLCVAAMALWTGTYWYHLQVLYGYERAVPGVSRSYAVVASASAIHLSCEWGRLSRGDGFVPGWSGAVISQRVLGTSHWTDGLLFYYHSGPTISGRRAQFGVPCWALALLFLIAPTLRVRRYRRRRRRPSGLCPECGYDLRGSPDICPECGAIVARAQTDSPPQTLTAG